MKIFKILALWLFPLAAINAQICPDTVQLYMTYEYNSNILDVSVKAKNFKNVIGLQFALEFDNNVGTFISASSSIPNFASSDYQLQNGHIRILKDNIAPFDLEDEDLVVFKFRIDEPLAEFYSRINDKLFKIEFVNDNQETLCYQETPIIIPPNGRKMRGRVIYDANKNCTVDSDEKGLDGWLVELSYLSKKYYRNSDELGFFEFIVPEGIYTLRIIPKSEIWGTCQDIIRTTVTQEDPEMVYFLASDFIDCPRIRTDLSVGSLKVCANNKYYLLIENQGTQTAENVEITIEYDEALSFVSSNGQIIGLPPNSIILNIGTLEVYQKDTIEVQLFLSCDGKTGQTHCVTAKANDTNPCFIPSTWSGAEIEVKSTCDSTNGKVKFEIANVGQGDMLQSERYIVTEDEVIKIGSTIELLAQALTEIEFPANGSTYRIFVQQPTDFPYLSKTATLAIEGCTTRQGDNFSIGFVNIFPESDQDIFIDKLCMESTDSESSASITAHPKGLGPKKYIENETQIEYIIEFSNFNEDVIQSVKLTNFISEDFDITTLQMGASSHPYRFVFNRDRELMIIFEDIHLASMSSGFVKFSIYPRTGLQNETKINMSTRIFYDLKEDIESVSTFHTVGQNFIRISSIAWEKEPLKISYYPNPTDDFLNFDLSLIDFQVGSYKLYCVTGQQMLQGPMIQEVNSISLKSLPSGQYFLNLILDDNKTAVFKILKQ